MQHEKRKGCEIMSDKRIVVYYKYNSTTNELCFDDDDERGYNKTTSSNKVEIKTFNHKDIQKAFDEEDGDGDECGSWSRNIIMITDEKNKMLWYPQSTWSKLLRRYESVDVQKVGKIYDDIIKQLKERIKQGVF